ncbi:hypothetical protein TrVE_jg10276 [Triparma verrucosa]|uniref:Uncharacterized protein n=1 Tax=Triparma verrucosa TaxID=1606542 RepID=A0A9W7BZ57_9STRA|nr:hypothetical protein TrVE_jg10276 [Triparma verrucosa]
MDSQDEETRVLRALNINKALTKNIAFQQLKAAAYKKKLEGTQNYAKFCETRVKRLEAQRGALTTPAVKKAIEQYQIEEEKKENSPALPAPAAPSPSKVNMPAGSPTAFRRAKSMFERRDSDSILARNFSPTAKSAKVTKEVSDVEVQTVLDDVIPEGTHLAGAILTLKDGSKMEFDSEANAFKVLEVQVEEEVEEEGLIVEEEFGEPTLGKQTFGVGSMLMMTSLLVIGAIGGLSLMKRRK